MSEHWLSNAEEIIAQNINSNRSHHIFFTGAEKHETGRPFGGNCFFVDKSIAEKVDVIHKDQNVLAIHLKSSTMNIIIIGVYLTCYHDRSSKEAQQLNSITSIMEMHIDESEIVVIGDFQTFPSLIYDNLPRVNLKRNPLSPILREFLVDNEMELVDIVAGVGPTYSYEHKTLKNQSYIDHAAIMKNSNLSVRECRIHEKSHINISDHQELELIIEHQPTLSSIIQEEIPHTIPKSAWKNHDFLTNYKEVLDNQLELLHFDTSVTSDAKVLALNDIMVQSADRAYMQTFPEGQKSFKRMVDARTYQSQEDPLHSLQHLER